MITMETENGLAVVTDSDFPRLRVIVHGDGLELQTPNHLTKDECTALTNIMEHILDEDV